MTRLYDLTTGLIAGMVLAAAVVGAYVVRAYRRTR